MLTAGTALQPWLFLPYAIATPVRGRLRLNCNLRERMFIRTIKHSPPRLQISHHNFKRASIHSSDTFFFSLFTSPLRANLHFEKNPESIMSDGRKAPFLLPDHSMPLLPSLYHSQVDRF